MNMENLKEVGTVNIPCPNCGCEVSKQFIEIDEKTNKSVFEVGACCDCDKITYTREKDRISFWNADKK